MNLKTSFVTILTTSVALCLGTAVQAQLGNERRFNAADQERAATVQRKGRLLFEVFSAAEHQLDVAGFDRDAIASAEMSWVAVVSEDRTLRAVSLYSREAEDSDAIYKVFQHREGDDGADPDAHLTTSMQASEWALVLAPTDCGRSFGVLGIMGSSDRHEVEIYIVQIGTSDVVTLGKNYVATATIDGIETFEPLSAYCATRSMERSTRLGATTLGYYDHNPLVDFPTAVHAMHALLLADSSYPVRVMAAPGTFTFRDGRLEPTYIRWR